MASDLYEVLGVPRTASEKEIQSAYRKLAKQHHPDLNPGNKAAEDKFKKVAAAHDILADPAKRARYDRGEIDNTGADRAPQQSYRHYADSHAGGSYARGGAEGVGGEGFEGLFSSLFDRHERRGPARGHDDRYRIDAEFLDALNGATKRLTLPDGQVLDVKIPIGTSSGDVLRLRGRGQPGQNGGPTGDALVEISVKAHKFYRREGQDVLLDVPISLKEAIEGGKINVPTPAGAVAMNIKPHAESGTVLRLRGRGVPAHGKELAGDLYAKLVIMLGPVDAALEGFVQGWQAPAFEPRKSLSEGT